MKTQLRGARVVLRSKTPELVKQEVWGLLLAHFAVRGLMHEAALQADEDPDRLSFSHAVRVVRRKLPQFAALPPSGQARKPSASADPDFSRSLDPGCSLRSRFGLTPVVGWPPRWEGSCHEPGRIA